MRITWASAKRWNTSTTHGVVHRDLKPENIMVDAEDRIKLIDFGIAGQRGLAPADFRQAFAGDGHAGLHFAGTGEGQARRCPQRIYALGVMLYEMLTGKVPFTGPNPFAIMNDRLLNNPGAAARNRSGDYSRAAGDYLSRDGARSEEPLCQRPRVCLGPGASGSGWAWRSVLN